MFHFSFVPFPITLPHMYGFEKTFLNKESSKKSWKRVIFVRLQSFSKSRNQRSPLDKKRKSARIQLYWSWNVRHPRCWTSATTSVLTLRVRAPRLTDNAQDTEASSGLFDLSVTPSNLPRSNDYEWTPQSHQIGVVDCLGEILLVQSRME